MNFSDTLPAAGPGVSGSLIHDLSKIIDDNRAELSKPPQMISRYRQEKGTNNDYKGRQLLELIQNADDAGSDYIRIVLDTKQAQLSLINGGTPFSLEGFRSLIIPNLSPKRKKIFIGNKGLGFRSILNWSQQVTVISAGVKLTFSKELARRAFYSLYPEERRKEILDEFQYSPDAIPFPIFALPEAVGVGFMPAQTSIVIGYLQDEETDIRIQLGMLREEVLLFLNHIRTIELDIDGEIASFISQRQGEKLIKIGNKTWQVYSNKQQGIEPALPAQYRDPETTEEEVYSLKIAVQQGVSDKVNRLFSFFPTKISLCLPMVVHGTFELDSSRNRLIDSAKNRFLVQELLLLIFQVSETWKNTTAASWDVLRLLNYQGQRDVVLDEFGFYKAIDERIKKESILPCLDGNYRSYESVYYYSNSFSEMAGKLTLAAFFPELLLPIPSDLHTYFNQQFPNYLMYRKYQPAILKSKAETASSMLCKTGKGTHMQYALWMAGLGAIIDSKAKERFSILYQESSISHGDKELIPSHFTIFTPATKRSNIQLPMHIRISYMSNDLYTALVKQYGLTEELEPSRKLKDKLEHFINLQPFEPAPVLTQIITGTNTAIVATSKGDERRKLVRAMLQSLFLYYQSSDRASRAQIRTNKIPLITLTGDILSAQDCFLSEHYPIGALRRELLGDIYLSDQLSATTEELGIAGDINEIQRFLTEFLGVNSYVKLVREEDRISRDSPYLAFLFAHQRRPDGFRDYKMSYTTISNLGDIKHNLQNGSITLEKLIAWMHLDPHIREKLPNNPGSNQDTIFQYSQDNRSRFSYPNRLDSIPSYICYQLTTITDLKHYVLEDAGISFLNEKDVDIKHAIFARHGIDTGIVKSILQRLGARNEFSDLDIHRISTIVRLLPEKDPQGRQARKIYQLCTDRYKEKKEVLIKQPGLLLHATYGAEKGYYPYQEVYYANNWDLPKKLLRAQPVLNFPKRSGEQNVTGFFAVRTFGNINYHAAGYTENTGSTGALGAYLDQIKPYILLLRLSKLRNNEDIEAAVKAVRALSITLCTELSYTYNGADQEAEPYDFVPSDEGRHAYLMKYEGSTGLGTLKKDSGLSDAIAEIITITFDVSNIQTEVRSLFRNDLEDTQHQFIQDYGEEDLLNAIAKLQTSEKNRDAWRIIYRLKQIATPVPATRDEKDFTTQIANDLRIDSGHVVQVDFGAMETLDQQKYLHDLLLALQIPLDTFNQESGLNIRLQKYHQEQFRQTVDQLKPVFTYRLWKYYSEQEVSKRKYFSKHIRGLDQLVLPLANLHATKWNIGYQYELLERIEEVYGITVIVTDPYNDDYLNQFKSNKKELAFSDDIINGLEDELLSLLYFPLSPDEWGVIKSKVQPKEDNHVPSFPASKGQGQDEEAADLEVKDIEILPPADRRGNRAPGNAAGDTRRGGNYRRGSTTASDTERNTLGKNAEQDVLHALEEKYGKLNVVWLSEYSDHPEKSDYLGYDIKFRENEMAVWHYVEVKWFGQRHFYLSALELNFAKKNRDFYTLYLVEEEKIKVVPFNVLLDENNELNEYNPYFSFEITEYKFTRLR